MPSKNTKSSKAKQPRNKRSATRKATTRRADGSNEACVDVRKGTVLIQACDFMAAGKPQIRVGSAADGVAITGCRLRGGERFDIAPEAHNRIQSAANLTR